jgi:hypothetical protein
MGGAVKPETVSENHPKQREMDRISDSLQTNPWIILGGFIILVPWFAPC